MSMLTVIASSSLYERPSRQLVQINNPSFESPRKTCGLFLASLVFFHSVQMQVYLAKNSYDKWIYFNGGPRGKNETGVTTHTRLVNLHLLTLIKLCSTTK